MDFQIHRYPASEKRIDIVILADFSQQEAEALDDSHAWDHPCIARIYAFRAFLSDISRFNITYKRLVTPGVMLEDFDPSYADTFQQKFESTYVKEAYNRLLPIVTAYRRKVHRDQERQRDEFMQATEPQQIGHYPQVRIISHEQRYLPSR
jgi:hypothetical protein